MLEKRNTHLKKLVTASLFVAMSIVLGKYLAFSTDLFRISFENLPVILAGIWLGPWYGASVGLVADVVGSILVGYAINPGISLGALSIGLAAGLVWKYLPLKHDLTRLALSLIVSHLIGSVLIKTVSLSIWFGSPFLPTLGLRILNYLAVGAAEWLVLLLLLRTPAFRSYFGKRS